MVPSLPKARTNRAETVLRWQTERARQNYYYLFQCRITLSSKTTSVAALEQSEEETATQ